MKKSILLLLAAFVFIISFQSCERLSNLPQLEFLEFNSGICHSDIIEGRYVIHNQELYDEIMPQFLVDTLDNPDCMNVVPPSINFDQHTLLGYRVCGSGCETIFTKEVFLDDENMKYIYRILVKEVGACEPYRCAMHWILVPALPKDYFVEFI